MRKHILPMLSAVSLALMLFTIAVTIHGCFAYDCTGYVRNHWTADNHFVASRCTVTSCQGRFYLHVVSWKQNYSTWPQTREGRTLLWVERNANPEVSALLTCSDSFAEHHFNGHFFGPTASTETLKACLFGFHAYTGDSIDLYCPAWLPILLLSLLPAYRLSARRRKSSSPDSAAAIPVLA